MRASPMHAVEKDTKKRHARPFRLPQWYLHEASDVPDDHRSVPGTSTFVTMKTSVAAAGLAAGASAAVLPRQDQCCFSLTASGGQSGQVGQLSDGQNRIGGGNPSGQYCLNGGSITDGNGRGCILTPPTTQFQCDMGASPDSGFSVSSNGQLQNNGESTFYACAAADGEYNIYTETSDDQTLCVEITLSTGGQCGGSGNGGSSSAPAASQGASSAAPSPSGYSAPASSPAAPESSAPATGEASVPGYSAPAPSAPAESAPASSAPGQSAPAPSAPAESAPAPSAPAFTAPAPSAPAESAPAPSAPAESAPAPSAPAQSGSTVTIYTTVCGCESGPGGAPSTAPVAPAPSAPAESVPAPSAPVESAPAPSAPVESVPAPSAPAYSAPAPSALVPSAPASESVPAYSAPAPSAPAPSAPASESAPAPSAPASESAPAPSAPAPASSSYPAVSESQPAPVPSQSSPAGPESSAPGYPTASTLATTQPASGTQPAASATGSGSACATSLVPGSYETPHLIVPVNSEQPDQSYGTSYNAYANGQNSTVFNFDIPQSNEGKTCSLVFLFPKKEDLETTDYTFNGQGNLEFSQLSGAVSEQTSYNSCPSEQQSLGSVTPVAGGSYIVQSGPCAAGTTETVQMTASGGLELEFFEDWNPSPLGLFITVC